MGLLVHRKRPVGPMRLICRRHTNPRRLNLTTRHATVVRVRYPLKFIECMASQCVHVIVGTRGEMAAYIRQGLVECEKRVNAAGIKIE